MSSGSIEPNELERHARQRLAGGVYEKDGYLTVEAIAELRAALPQLDQRGWCLGVQGGPAIAADGSAAFVSIIWAGN